MANNRRNNGRGGEGDHCWLCGAERADALLPAFPGAHGIKDAFDYGVKVFGVTIHYVDSGIDTGEIIDQASFHINGTETIDEVEAQIHAIEHKLYPATIQKLLEDNNL